jgi:hypothetical protein
MGQIIPFPARSAPDPLSHLEQTPEYALMIAILTALPVRMRRKVRAQAALLHQYLPCDATKAAALFAADAVTAG